MVIKAKWKNIENINISLPRLKHLAMDFVEGLCDFFHRSNIVLDLPNLLRFHYVDFLASNYFLENLESLEEARIEVSLDLEYGDSDTFRGPALDLLKGISNTKHLSLTGNGMEVGGYKLYAYCCLLLLVRLHGLLNDSFPCSNFVFFHGWRL